MLKINLASTSKVKTDINYGLVITMAQENLAKFANMIHHRLLVISHHTR